MHNQESVYRAIEIKDDNNNSQLLELEDDNKSNFVYNNLKDELRFDLEVVADNRENKTKIENRSHLYLKVETIIIQPAS